MRFWGIGFQGAWFGGFGGGLGLVSSLLWGVRVPCFWQMLDFGDPGLGGLFFLNIGVLGFRF